VILSTKTVPLASSCGKKPRIGDWFGRNQGKNEKYRVEEKN
jgi:hypothetical protein